MALALGYYSTCSSALIMVSSVLLTCAGNHHGRRLLDWGWGYRESQSHEADHNNRPFCGQSPWFGNWFSSSGSSSAAASPAAAPGGRKPFMHKLWPYIRDKHGVMFHSALWLVGHVHFSWVWGEIWMYYWMSFWGHGYPWPSLRWGLL